MGITLAFLGTLMTGQDDAACAKALQAVFEAAEKCIRANDAEGFGKLWHPEGLAKNLVGGSGLEGGSVLSQGSRKKWFPKADLAKTVVLGEGAAVLVPCAIWAWEKEKAVDHVVFLVVKDKDAWLLLGGGEKRAEVEALASRWLKKEPLAPAKKDE